MDDAEGRREEKKMREGMIISTGLKTVVEAIHASPTQSVLYLSGGASQVSLSLSLSSYIHTY